MWYIWYVLVDGDLFASKFEAFKYENKKDIFSYELMVCKVESSSLVNPATNDEFGEAEIFNEHIHAQISHHKLALVVNFSFNLLY